MRSRAYWRLNALLVLSVVFTPRSAPAQSSACTQRVERDAPSNTSETKIIVSSIEFHGDNPLSEPLRDHLATEIQNHSPYLAANESDTSWAQEAIEPVREELQERGYFKNLVEAKPFLIRVGTLEMTFALRVVIESGPQYRLGALTFKSESGTPLTFSQEALRKLFSLGNGEILDVSKIRAGLDALDSLYSTHGYSDATFAPEESINEDNSEVDVLVRITEGEPYRIAKVDVFGLNTATVAQLKMPQTIGDVFNPILWDVSFFEDNKSLLPEGASPKDFGGVRNASNHTYQLILDLRPCKEQLTHP